MRGPLDNTHEHQLMRATCTVTLAFLLGGCNTDPGACTLILVPGITVRALDAGTNENVTDGAQGTVSEGAYVDSLRPGLQDADSRVLLLSAAYERPGSYDVFVERPGYQAVSLSAVEVTADECHVHTVGLSLTMVRIP
jgi:hypothetical protein